MYLMIDKRSFVGNDVLFWAKNHRGYCTSIDQAHVFDEDEARKIEAGRSTDVAIPYSEAEKVARRCVDFQHLDRKYFECGFSYFDKNSEESKSEKTIELLNSKIRKLERLFDNAEYWRDEYNAGIEDIIEEMKKQALEIIEEKIRD